MIALSTSLLEYLPAEEIVGTARDLGFESLEMNFRLDPRKTRQLIKSAQIAGLQINSLHNFVPEPPQGESAFMLSDLDDSLRKKAVSLTIDTIQLAADIGARAVVLHLGHPRNWDYSEHQRALRQAIFEKQDEEQIIKLRQSLIDTRKGLPTAYLDSILHSLDKIAPVADNLGIGLGVENRYNYCQFPDYEEIGIVLQEFSGSTLGYWHDCGHAAHRLYCGLDKPENYLNSYGNRLVGIHLHDIKGWHDHRIPSEDGDIDFAYLKPYIKDNTLLALELSPEAKIGEVGNGIRYLALSGIQ